MINTVEVQPATTSFLKKLIRIENKEKKQAKDDPVNPKSDIILSGVVELKTINLRAFFTAPVTVLLSVLFREVY